MTTWFTSDTHFAHANIIEYCKRPFANVEEMNQTMIEKWNARVKPDDLVYHLGDFAFGPAENIPKFLGLLNGRVSLVRGNHDRSLKRMSTFGFARVDESVCFHPEEGRHRWEGLSTAQMLLLTHKPASGSFDVEIGAALNLHGHVHDTYKRRGPFINVGVDVRDFEPKTLKELLAP